MSTTYSLGPESSLLLLTLYLSTEVYNSKKRQSGISELSSLSILTLLVHVNTFGKSPRDVIYSQLFKEKNLSFAAQVLSTHGSFIDRFPGYNVRNGMNPSIPMILRSSSSELESSSSSSPSLFLSL